jgi:predicted MFS family arabinose efflux permease
VAVETITTEHRGGWPLVWALAVAQLVSWGAIYYSFSLFVVPMEKELGWSRTELTGALSLGLLVAGLCAYPVGSWIDRHGGRLVMTLGSLLGAALLALWSRVSDPAAFYAIWIGLGIALAATLYEPVFAVITRAFHASYRTKITALTLIGGFASTVFIPLTDLFIKTLGWRDALVALALCVVAVSLPVHAFLLRDDASPGDGAGSQGGIAPALASSAVRRAVRHPAFWGLAVCFTAYYTTFTALTFHLIPLLTERGVPSSMIIAALAAIGPAQVAGRIVLLALGRRLTTAWVGRIVVFLFPASVLLLLWLPDSEIALFAFALVYGAGNGIMTIIRGTAVPDLLWREGYGAVNGALTLPHNLARAGAPFVAAFIWRVAGGYDSVLWAIIVGGLIGALAFWFAAAVAEPRDEAA